MDLLSTDGLNGLTSGKLAKKLNISKGTLFHHFKSMEELHVAVLDVIIAASTKEINSTEIHSTKEFVELFVETMFTDMSRYRAGYAALFNFIGSAESNEVYRMKLKGMFETTINRWAVLLTDKLNKEIPKNRLHDMVRLLDLHFAGLLAHNIIFRDLKTYRDLTTRFLYMVFTEMD